MTLFSHPTFINCEVYLTRISEGATSTITLNNYRMVGSAQDKESYTLSMIADHVIAIDYKSIYEPTFHRGIVIFSYRANLLVMHRISLIEWVRSAYVIIRTPGLHVDVST